MDQGRIRAQGPHQGNLVANGLFGHVHARVHITVEIETSAVGDILPNGLRIRTDVEETDAPHLLDVGEQLLLVGQCELPVDLWRQDIGRTERVEDIAYIHDGLEHHFADIFHTIQGQRDHRFGVIRIIGQICKEFVGARHHLGRCDGAAHRRGQGVVFFSSLFDNGLNFFLDGPQAPFFRVEPFRQITFLESVKILFGWRGMG